MSLELTPDNAQFVNDQVAAGLFASDDAAVNAAVELLKRQAWLRAKLQHSIDQLERGEYIELDDEGLDRYFAELFEIAQGESTP